MVYLLRIYELYLMESAFFVTGIMGTKFLRWMVNVAKSSLSPLFVARALQGEGSKIGVSTYLYLTYWPFNLIDTLDFLINEHCAFIYLFPREILRCAALFHSSEQYYDSPVRYSILTVRLLESIDFLIVLDYLTLYWRWLKRIRLEAYSILILFYSTVLCLKLEKCLYFFNIRIT